MTNSNPVGAYAIADLPPLTEWGDQAIISEFTACVVRDTKAGLRRDSLDTEALRTEVLRRMGVPR